MNHTITYGKTYAFMEKSYVFMEISSLREGSLSISFHDTIRKPAMYAFLSLERLRKCFHRADQLARTVPGSSMGLRAGLLRMDHLTETKKF